MRTLVDILKKDRTGNFEWLEAVKDVETAKRRLLQLSTESPDEFIAFRETDLQVIATSQASSVVDLKLIGEECPPPSRGGLENGKALTHCDYCGAQPPARSVCLR